MGFSYSMNGATTGTLEVRVGDLVVWSMGGPQGAGWLQAHVALGSADNFTFVASRGTANSGDIAVDGARRGRT